MYICICSSSPSPSFKGRRGESKFWTQGATANRARTAAACKRFTVSLENSAEISCLAFLESQECRNRISSSEASQWRWDEWCCRSGNDAKSSPLPCQLLWFLGLVFLCLACCLEGCLGIPDLWDGGGASTGLGSIGLKVGTPIDPSDVRFASRQMPLYHNMVHAPACLSKWKQQISVCSPSSNRQSPWLQKEGTPRKQVRDAGSEDCQHLEQVVTNPFPGLAGCAGRGRLCWCGHQCSWLRFSMLWSLQF